MSTADPTATGAGRRIRMGRQEFVAFLATISATTALGIDMVLPAFGDVREAFGLPEDSTQVALTVTVYFLGLALAQIFYGPLTDRFGRKPVLLASLALYAVSAVVSGLAPGLTVLLISRLAWGIGAAGPRVLLMAIARDVYDGDQLARVLSLAAAIFMVVPAVAPLLGQGVLAVSGWRMAFAAPFLPAVLLLAWATLRLDETLAPQDRRPLTFTRTTEAIRAVTRDRRALGYSLALMFDFAAFASFLSSTEALFDRIYDRSTQFPLFFGGMSAVMGVAALTGSRLVGSVGARRMILVLFRYNLMGTAALFAISVAAGGAPNFWLWFGLLTVANATRVIVNPLAGSEAMQGLGQLAGTAAAVVGTISLGGGAILASITDRFIRDSVTPLSAAYLFYGLAELVAILYARKVVSPSSSVGDPFAETADVGPEHDREDHEPGDGQ